MNIKKALFLFLLFFTSSIYSQSNELYSRMENAYKRSNYKEAIKLSKVVLKQKLNKDEFIEVNEIRAVCFYSIGEKDSSQISFTEILRIDEKYYPNKLFISPKIILFFESVKTEFEKKVSENKIKVFEERVDSSKIEESMNRITKTITYSILIPGIGHLLTGQKTKGWLITATSVSLLGSSIYFVINTNKLEKEYLSENRKEKFQEKYDAYNSSYKIRNTLLISYGILWTFTQLDLLVFNQEKLFGNHFNISSSISNSNNSASLTLSFRYSF